MDEEEKLGKQEEKEGGEVTDRLSSFSLMGEKERKKRFVDHGF